MITVCCGAEIAVTDGACARAVLANVNNPSANPEMMTINRAMK
jgi:hypothetical protein